MKTSYKSDELKNKKGGGIHNSGTYDVSMVANGLLSFCARRLRNNLCTNYLHIWEDFNSSMTVHYICFFEIFVK